jgi:hypothetical protein
MLGRRSTKLNIPVRISSSPIIVSKKATTTVTIQKNRYHHQYSERLALPFAVAYLFKTLEID